MEAAGVALGAAALVPPTLQLIDSCANFYAEVIHSEASKRQIHLRFVFIRRRYDALQRILFHSGKFTFTSATLFEFLSDQDQNVIYRMFQELAELFCRQYLLFQTYRVDSKPAISKLPEIEVLATVLAIPETSLECLRPTEGRSSLASLRHILWAARGKKRAERLLTEFEEWLRRIRDIIEDNWWNSPSLENYAHLQSLENDKDTKEVGISSAAGLKKLLLDTTQASKNLNIDVADLNIEYISPRRGIARLDGQPILVEAFQFDADTAGHTPQLLTRRFEAIANLLYRQENIELRVLPCKGYRYSSSPFTQFQLLLEIPAKSSSKPITLLDVLGMKMKEKPDLKQRIRLCWQIAQCLITMHSIGWLHRGLRSENIICFVPTDIEDINETLASYFFEHFIVSGFDSSRLETDFSVGPYDNMIEKNVYRHPERWGAPQRTFSRLHDIYALGVIFLEICLWEKALFVGGNNFVARPKNATATSAELCRQAEVRVGHRCGSKMRGIVLRCLKGDFVSPEILGSETYGTGLQSMFRETIVEPLHRLYLEL